MRSSLRIPKVTVGSKKQPGPGRKASETHSLESKFLDILEGPGVHGPIGTVGTED